jgi:hypothetical protein
MLEWFSSAGDSAMEITMMTLYHMWLARNAAKETQKIEDPGQIARQAINLLEEWHNIQTVRSAKPALSKERWLRPEEGWVKINADVAMQQDSGKGGGGVVVRGYDGRFLAGACHFSVDMAKVLKFKKIVLKSDSLVAVSKLNKE